MKPGVITLYELNSKVKRLVADNFAFGVWISAEINSISENRNGHCYLELVQKDDDGDRIVAKSGATIWRNRWLIIRPFFESATGTTLSRGIKVLVKVTPVFHEEFGYSLNISDIDPEYSVGDLAFRKMQVIRQLKEEAVFDMNRELVLPALVKRIAVVSAAGAAGFGDFCNQLRCNDRGIKYKIELFEAIMQGENAEKSIISALERIFERESEFDLVAIVRGGGAVSDLHCFDSYGLCCTCAQFPLPIFSGVGHDRDVSVLDMVAYGAFKTPTAVAEAILDIALGQLQMIDSLAGEICDIARRRIVLASHRVDVLVNEIANGVRTVLGNNRHRLDMMEKEIELLSPSALLKRGYSLTVKDGVRVTASSLTKGDRIETWFADGKIESEVL